MIAFPTGLRLGRRRIGVGPAAFLLVALATLAAELVLVDLRAPLFGGGGIRFRTIDRLDEAAFFLAGLIASHLLLVLILFRSLRRLHGRRGRDPIFYFNFIFILTPLFAAVLAAKYRVLGYFSDAISFQIIRNLGGGSLAQAFLYVLDEASFLFLGLGFAALLYWLLLRTFDLRRGEAALPAGPVRPRLRFILLAVPALALLLLQAGRVGDARPPLERFLAPYLAYWALNALTDVDRDGYSLFSRQRDADPLDPDRHPFALDVPGNGVDEDGYGGDFAWRGGGEAMPAPSFPGARKHVVLIVLESTRADALTRTWAGRRIAPNLAAMAERGSAAPEAFSHVGFTRESLKSLFTGRLEPADDGQSLFRDFKQAGYRVGVLSGQAEDFGGIASAVAMRRHSDVFVDAKTHAGESILPFTRDISLLLDGKVLLREMDRHFGRREAWRQPTFLYFNVQAAHFPYDFPGAPQMLPGRPVSRAEIGYANRERVARTYWNAVAYADRIVGGIVARLKALGVYDQAVVVVLGDHGEELFENGYVGHGQVLNRLQTHIPLIFSPPGTAIPNPVGLADLRRLILRSAGAEVPPGPAGRPVFQYIGTLERPSSIGMVEKGGVSTTLDLQTEEVSSSDGGERGPYRRLPAGSRLKARADRLVELWARQRWIKRLAAQR